MSRLPIRHEDGTSGSWDEWRIAVITGITRIEAEQASLRSDISRLDDKLLALEHKAGVWGALGAILPVISLILILFLDKLVK